MYDFGAGTFDASVVRCTAEGYTVLATAGLPDVGGLDIDASLVAHLGAVYGGRDPDRWRRITQPATSHDRRSHRLLWDDVRMAKEMLSRATATFIHIPLLDEDAPLGREQLDRPIVDRTVAATRQAIRAADIAQSTVAGVFLVGGSSRLTLVNTLLHTALGIAPTTFEQPELVVAEGSLAPSAVPAAGFAAPTPSAGAPTPAAAPAPPVEAVPAEAEVAAKAAEPGYTLPPLAAPDAWPQPDLSDPFAAAAPPVSGASSFGPPISGPPISPAPTYPAFTHPALISPVPAPPIGNGGPPPRPAGSTRPLLIGGVLLAVVVAVAVIVWANFPGPGPGPGPTHAATTFVADPVTTGPTTTGPTTPVPATTSPLSDQRDSGGFTAAERTLLAKLSTSDFKTCTPRTNEENANVVAALDCVAAQTGPDLQPLVMQFVSHSAMQAHIDRVKGALSTGGDCSTGMSYGGHWKQSGTTKGDLICDQIDGYHRIMWSYDDGNIVMVAEAKDAVALWNWWKSVSF